MATTLSQEIEAFQSQLTSIRQKYGSGWAVVVDRSCRAAFPNFEAAATYAVENFPTAQYLIRHTDERQAQIPFVAVEE